MFDKLKQLKQLKDLQSAIKKESHIGESNGVKVTINGAFEMQNVEISNDLNKEDIATAVKQAYTVAMQSAQNSAAKMMSGLMGQ